MSRPVTLVKNQDGSVSPKEWGVDLGKTFGPETVSVQIDEATAATLKSLVAEATDFADFKAAVEAL